MRYLFLILFLTTNLFGQSTDELNSQLQAYEVKFKNLMATRGLSYSEGKVNKQKIENVILQYCRQSDGKINSTFGLLFYHFESDTLYHWLFNAQGVEATARLPVTSDSLINLENTIKFSLNVDAMLANRGVYKNTQRKYRLRTYESIPIISDILFPESIRQKLKGKQHLVILPILNLSSFPYAMLKPWGEKHGTLIDSMSYSFAHNFTQFFQSVERNAMSYDANYASGNHGIQFELINPIICGNPAFTDSCTQKLNQLPGAEREVKWVGELLNVAVLTGDDARRQTVLDQIETSNFIYLATHGWADPENSLDKSFIALSGGDECGYITPREIQGMNLRGKPIVILSACQTGLGMIHEAGIIGLARGFLKAGSQSVIMSLWNVNDEETEKLMILFAEELKKPYPFFPAEHWRQAVLKYKSNKKADPLNWSAFQQFGVPYRLVGSVKLGAAPSK
jgi:CHAT domain-containing protein